MGSPAFRSSVEWLKDELITNRAAVRLLTRQMRDAWPREWISRSMHSICRKIFAESSITSSTITYTVGPPIPASDVINGSNLDDFLTTPMVLTLNSSPPGTTPKRSRSMGIPTPTSCIEGSIPQKTSLMRCSESAPNYCPECYYPSGDSRNQKFGKSPKNSVWESLGRKTARKSASSHKDTTVISFEPENQRNLLTPVARS